MMRNIIKYFYLPLLVYLMVSCIDFFEPTEEDPKKIEIENRIRSSLQGDFVYYKDHYKLYVNDNLIVNNASSEIGPKWSPSGRKIAYIRKYGASWLLIVTDRDGNKISGWELVFSSRPIIPLAITWSPDGSTIAILAYQPSGNYLIKYININTREIINTTLKSNPGFHYSTIAWCPLNNKIAISHRYSTPYGYSKGRDSISMMIPYETDPRKNPNNYILTNRDVWVRTIKHIDWSLDGSMLVYSGNHTSPLYIANTDGTNHRKIELTGIYQHELVRGHSPCWSSDNQQIMYSGVTGVEGTTLIIGLRVVDIEGTYDVEIISEGEYPDWH